MAALHLVLVCLVILCASSIALALECYECGPGPGGKSNCGTNSMGKITCGQFFDRCFAIKATMSIGVGTVSMEQRNCSNSMACDPKSPLNTCTLINTTGAFTSCEMACCQGNLCDPFKLTTPTTPTSTSPILAANVGAILLAFFVNLFA